MVVCVYAVCAQTVVSAGFFLRVGVFFPPNFHTTPHTVSGIWVFFLRVVVFFTQMVVFWVFWVLL